jgi:hypothetical protein
MAVRRGRIVNIRNGRRFRTIATLTSPATSTVYHVSFSETASFSETLTKLVRKQMSESASCSETLTKRVRKQMAEAASLAESLSRRVTFRKSMAETADTAETMTTRFIAGAAVVGAAKNLYKRILSGLSHAHQ